MGGTTSADECITHGPWGGSQGKEWIYMPKGFIKKITIVHAEVIDRIRFQSDCETETSIFGGEGGERTDTICIDHPKEYLTAISGTIDSYKGSEVVTSLCFHTNEIRYGPYGCNTGNRFSYDGKGGMIVGFHGRVGKYSYIDAIGVYVLPKSLALDRYSTFEDIDSMLCCKMSRLEMPREVGPWGASGGKPWDDGVFLNVKQVHVHVGVSLNVIYGIQFQYVKRDGKSILSQLHGDGGTSADKIELFNLDGTDECLTGISGFYGPVEGYKGLEAITSICFHTNKGIHGPYGEECGAGYVSFTSTASPGKIVGFHGRNDGFLSAIGVHMEYF